MVANQKRLYYGYSLFGFKEYQTRCSWKISNIQSIVIIKWIQQSIRIVRCSFGE